MRKSRKNYIWLRVAIAATGYDIGDSLASNLRECGFVEGAKISAKANQITAEELDAGCKATWTLQHFEMPFTISKSPNHDNRKGRTFYYAPGVKGLLFADYVPRLETRDTRRTSDWDKLHDKRVVRRMYRQMAKNFAGAVELNLARGHKR